MMRVRACTPNLRTLFIGILVIERGPTLIDASNSLRDIGEAFLAGIV